MREWLGDGKWEEGMELSGNGIWEEMRRERGSGNGICLYGGDEGRGLGMV